MHENLNRVCTCTYYRASIYIFTKLGIWDLLFRFFRTVKKCETSTVLEKNDMKIIYTTSNVITVEMRFLIFFVIDCLQHFFKTNLITNIIEVIIEKDRVLNPLFLFYTVTTWVFYPNLPRGQHKFEEQLKVNIQMQNVLPFISGIEAFVTQ